MKKKNRTYIALESIKLDDGVVPQLESKLEIASGTNPVHLSEISIPDCEQLIDRASLPSQSTLGKTQQSELGGIAQVDVVKLVDLVAHDWYE